MATIPLGNFGQSVARGPAPAPAPLADVVGQANNRLAQTAYGIAHDEAQAQAQLNEQERQRQAQAAEAAARGKEALALQQTQDALTDLHDTVADGVRSGAIPKDKAEEQWRQEAAKLTSKASESFRPENQALVTARLQGIADRLGNGVRKAREQRDRQDVTISLDGILESAQREYGKDPAGATAKVDGALAALGPMSTYAPDVLARKGQAWREGAQFNVAYEAVSAGRNNPTALKNAEVLISKLDGLDPQKKSVLLDRAQGYRLHQEQQAEMAAARAARENERLLNKAAAEFQVFQGLADKGTLISPEYIDRAITATAGTPYAEGIRALAQQAKEAGGIAAQPVAVQRATLDAIDTQIATQGRTPELDKRREQVRKVFEGTEGDVKRDPLRAGLERGVITKLQPLDVSAGVPGLVQQMSDRITQADRVRQWAGQPVSPLTGEEAAQVGRALSTLPPDGRANAVAMLAGAMPPDQSQALAKQIDAQDRPLALALAVGTQRTTQGRATSELILRGAQAVKDKSIKEERGAEFGVRALIAKEVGEAVSGQAREDVIDAARLIYLGKQAAGESMSESGAVALALGGPIVEHNGRRIPVPAGLDADTLRQKLAAIPATKINAQQVQVGNRSMTVAEFLQVLPSAQLEPAGQGRYVVRSGGMLVMNEQRRPVVVDVR